jgi:rhodanese-related sulfurtransferase
MLSDMKFTKVSVLIGGWYAWLKAGYPVEPK